MKIFLIAVRLIHIKTHSLFGLTICNLLGKGRRHQYTRCFKKRTLQWYSKCYSVARITKALTHKDVQIIHRSMIFVCVRVSKFSKYFHNFHKYLYVFRAIDWNPKYYVYK
jgi:hypothetical protein